MDFELQLKQYMIVWLSNGFTDIGGDDYSDIPFYAGYSSVGDDTLYIVATIKKRTSVLHGFSRIIEYDDVTENKVVATIKDIIFSINCYSPKDHESQHIGELVEEILLNNVYLPRKFNTTLDFNFVVRSIGTPYVENAIKIDDGKGKNWKTIVNIEMQIGYAEYQKGIWDVLVDKKD